MGGSLEAPAPPSDRAGNLVIALGEIPRQPLRSAAAHAVEPAAPARIPHARTMISGSPRVPVDERPCVCTSNRLVAKDRRRWSSVGGPPSLADSDENTSRCPCCPQQRAEQRNVPEGGERVDRSSSRPAPRPVRRQGAAHTQQGGSWRKKRSDAEKPRPPVKTTKKGK